MLAMACPTTWRILLTFLGHAWEKMGVRQEGRCRPGSPVRAAQPGELQGRSG